MKKNKTIYFLIIVFIWLVLKDAEGLFMYAKSEDYMFLSGAGLPAVYFFISTASMTIGLATLIFLFRPKAVGLHISIYGILFRILAAGVVMILSLMNIDAVKHLASTKTSASGRTMTLEMIDTFVSPTVMVSTFLVMTLFYALLFYLLRKNRAYFLQG